MLIQYLLIALGTIIVLAAIFAIFYLVDKKGGDKRTIGVLRQMAVFMSMNSVDANQRRVR